MRVHILLLLTLMLHRWLCACVPDACLGVGCVRVCLSGRCNAVNEWTSEPIEREWARGKGWGQEWTDMRVLKVLYTWSPLKRPTRACSMEKATPQPTARSGKKKSPPPYRSVTDPLEYVYSIASMSILRLLHWRKVGKSPVAAYNKIAHIAVHLAVSPVYFALILAFISLAEFVAHRSGGPAGYGTTFVPRKVPKLTVPSRPKRSQVANRGRAAILKSQLRSGLDRPQLLVE